MGWKARRFIPLAIIVGAPFLAAQVQWLMGLLARAHRWLSLGTIVAAAALAIPLLVYAKKLSRMYHPDHPKFPRQTFFDRMHSMWAQPVGAAEFLAANQITGRVYHDWRWEGYLHWKCPQLKLFLGGRAHQVYDRETVILGDRILADPQKTPTNPTADLANIGVHIVIVPRDQRHAALGVASGGAAWRLLDLPLRRCPRSRRR